MKHHWTKDKIQYLQMVKGHAEMRIAQLQANCRHEQLEPKKELANASLLQCVNCHKEFVRIGGNQALRALGQTR